MQKIYWMRAFKLAWMETLDLFGVGRVGVIMTQLIVSFLAITFTLWWSKTSAIDSAVNSIAVTAAISCLFPIIWVYKLALTPAKMANVQDKKYAELELNLSKQKDSKKILNALSDFMLDGHNLYKRKVTNGQEFEQYKEDFFQWRTQTAQFINDNLSPATATSFFLISSIQSGVIIGIYNDGHNNILLNLSEYLNRLRILIEKYQD